MEAQTTFEGRPIGVRIGCKANYIAGNFLCFPLCASANIIRLRPDYAIHSRQDLEIIPGKSQRKSRPGKKESQSVFCR